MIAKGTRGETIHPIGLRDIRWRRAGQSKRERLSLSPISSSAYCPGQRTGQVEAKFGLQTQYVLPQTPVLGATSAEAIRCPLAKTSPREPVQWRVSILIVASEPAQPMCGVSD